MSESMKESELKQSQKMRTFSHVKIGQLGADLFAPNCAKNLTHIMPALCVCIFWSYYPSRQSNKTSAVLSASSWKNNLHFQKNTSSEDFFLFPHHCSKTGLQHIVWSLRQKKGVIHFGNGTPLDHHYDVQKEVFQQCLVFKNWYFLYPILILPPFFLHSKLPQFF